MSFFEKIGDSIANVLKAPFQLAEQGMGIIGNTADNLTTPNRQTGFVDGGINWGSRNTGDMGAFFQRNAGILMLLVGGAMLVWLISASKKKR